MNRKLSVIAPEKSPVKIWIMTRSSLTAADNINNGHCSSPPPDNGLKNLDIVSNLTFWPCRIASLVGYWPFILPKRDDNDGSNNFKFSWQSHPTIITLTQLTLAILSGFVLSYHSSEIFNPYADQLTTTEKVGYFLAPAVEMMTFFYLTTFGLRRRRQVVTFWNKLTLTVLDLYKVIHNDDNGRHEKMYQIWVNECRKLSKKIVIIITLGVVINSSLSSIDMVASLFILYEWRTALFYAIPFLLYGVTISLRLIYNLVLGSIISVIGICYKIMDHEIVATFSSCPPLDDDDDDKVTVMKETENIQILSHLKLALRLQAVVHNFNQLFQTPFLIISAILVIPMAFYIFFAIMASQTVYIKFVQIGMTAGALIVGFIFSLLCNQATLMTHQAEKFGSSLAHILLQKKEIPAQTLAMIQLYSIKSASKPPQISAGQYISINNKLITSMVAATATYLVILIQFNAGLGTAVTECRMNNNYTSK